jgi:hypothetical protein
MQALYVSTEAPDARQTRNIFLLQGCIQPQVSDVLMSQPSQTRDR